MIMNGLDKTYMHSRIFYKDEITVTESQNLETVTYIVQVLELAFGRNRKGKKLTRQSKQVVEQTGTTTLQC